MKFPVLYWEGNVLFDILLHPWAVYRIPLKPYAYQSLEKNAGQLPSCSIFCMGIKEMGSSCP